MLTILRCTFSFSQDFSIDAPLFWFTSYFTGNGFCIWNYNDIILPGNFSHPFPYLPSTNIIENWDITSKRPTWKSLKTKPFWEI